MVSTRLGSALLLIILTQCPGLAHAQGPSSEQRTRALEKAQEGLTSYRSEHWQKAYESFRAAAELYDAPSVLIYLARSERKLGKLTEARSTYEHILEIPVPKNAPAPFVSAREDAEN